MFYIPLAQAAAGAGEALNTALTTNITPTSILNDFIAILPWVAGMVGVAFLIYMARKLIKGAGKGKVRV